MAIIITIVINTTIAIIIITTIIIIIITIIIITIIISTCVSFRSKTRVRLGQAFGTMGDSTLVARADDAVARSKSIAPTSSDESPGDGELRLVDAASGQAKRASRSPSQKMTSATIGAPT